MADQETIEAVGRELGEVMRAIGRPRSEVMMGRLFEAVAPTLRELAMSLEADDDEQLAESVDELREAATEVRQICPAE